jgi:hypothetical protein
VHGRRDADPGLSDGRAARRGWLRAFRTCADRSRHPCDPCGDVPIICTHLVTLTGPDGTSHEGLFDDHRSEPSPPPPTLVGDVTTSIAPGRCAATFTITVTVAFAPDSIPFKPTTCTASVQVD